jgi:hypothetical protein
MTLEDIPAERLEQLRAWVCAHGRYAARDQIEAALERIVALEGAWLRPVSAPRPAPAGWDTLENAR